MPEPENAEAPETSTVETTAPEVNDTAGEPENPSEESKKPTETVDFWKAKAREQEKRAKENAAAAKKLADLEESQKTELQKAIDRAEAAEGVANALQAAEVIREAKDALGQKYGLTPQSLKALRGSDLDELEEHAQLLKSLQPEPPAPGQVRSEGRTVTPGTGDPAQQFADLIRNARK